MSAAPSPRTSLAEAKATREVRIVAIELADDEGGGSAAWLAAVGLHEGEGVTVLRRAIFGGPLHVRTASGGEFAVARELATHIVVVDA